MNEFEQGSEQWLQARKGRFTSSQIYKLMTEPRTKAAKEAGELSEGAKTYVMEKALELAYGCDFSFDGNDATQWGNDWEAEALATYEKQFFTTVERTGFIPDADFGGGSPDGIENGDTIIEIKTPYNEKNFFEVVYTGKYPKQYYWQVQDLMRITNCDSARLVYFNPHEGRKYLYCFDIDRNADDIERIEEKLSEAVKMRKQIIDDLKNKLK